METNTQIADRRQAQNQPELFPHDWIDHSSAVGMEERTAPNSIPDGGKNGPDWLSEPPAVPVDTSLAAADRIAKLPKTKRDEAALLSWLQALGTMGATDDEIKAGFGWDGDYERPRRWRLVKDGLIYASADRRKTKDGNPAIVWKVKP